MIEDAEVSGSKGGGLGISMLLMKESFKLL